MIESSKLDAESCTPVSWVEYNGDVSIVSFAGWMFLVTNIFVFGVSTSTHVGLYFLRRFSFAKVVGIK